LLVFFSGSWSPAGSFRTLSFVGLNYLILGVAGGLFSIANTRIAMDTMPVMGRNHFFALFTVFASLSLGLSPIFWGVFSRYFG